MAALTNCLCRKLAKIPGRIFAVSISHLHETRSHRRLFRTNSSVFNSDGIVITESCSKRLKTILAKDEFLRILVEGGGCSGFQYKFDVDSQLEEDDRIFGKDEGRVVIDEESLKLIEGSSLDYQVEMIKSGFVVSKNPNADKGCSCGSSFSVKI